MLSHFVFNVFLLSQLPQTDLDALDANCRRFRLENGESLAEIDEVSTFVFSTDCDTMCLRSTNVNFAVSDIHTQL